MGDVRASVLIPTHAHHLTLPMTVRSVLRQSVSQLEVIIIGDGVSPDVRSAALALVGEDDRVRFLDLPKEKHHGETHRHTAILGAQSDAILYLCDDDLLLPDHVADLLSLLADHNFVQSLNGTIAPNGQLRLHPCDLAVPESVAWHLLEPRRNRVSLTGTAHTREFYLAIDDPWEPTPADEWPDHYMWKKFMRRPEFRGATSTRMTALQFPSTLRATWTDVERGAEIEPWFRRLAEPGAQAHVDDLVAVESRRRLDELARSLNVARGRVAYRNDAIAKKNATIEKLKVKVERLSQRAERRAARIAQLEEKLRALEQSRSWRWTRPLRWLRRKV